MNTPLGSPPNGQTPRPILLLMPVVLLAATALAFASIGNSAGVASAGPVSQPTGTPGQRGCQFSILEFKDCIRGNCAEYEIPLQNTGDEPVTVTGYVEFQGPNNQVLATQAIPSTTVPARGQAIVTGSVCVQGPLPPGPYQFRVVIQDIGRACDEKHKSQPLDFCAGAQPSPSPGTPTLTPQTPPPTATREPTPGPGTPTWTPAPPTPTKEPVTPGPGTPTGTVVGATPSPGVGTPTGTVVGATPPPGPGTPTIVGITPPPIGGTPQPTATQQVGGAPPPPPPPGGFATATPGPGGQVGGLPGGGVGMPRTGSQNGANWVLLAVLGLSIAMIAVGTLASRRSARGKASKP